MFRKGSLLTLFFIVALVISTVIKVLSVSNYSFAFTFDQGRDMMDLRRMVVTHTPRLVGPTTSINGVLLGPFYYYFILPLFILFKGDPLAIILWQSLWYQLGVVFLWFILKRKSLTQANISATLLLLMPTGFYTARLFFNANLMPVFTIFFFGILIDLLSNITNKKSLLMGIFCGLSLQIEAAFGVLFFPFVLLLLLAKKISRKAALYLTGGFFITLIPQFLFEIRHGFLMTKLFLDETVGRSSILGPKLDWETKVFERSTLFVNLIRDTNHIPFEILQVIYLILILFAFIGFFLYRQKNDRVPNYLLSLSVLFIIFSAIFYLAFPQQVKHWYTLGLSIPLVLFISGTLERIYSKNLLGTFAVWLFLFLALTNTIKAHTEYIEGNSLKSADPSNLRNEIEAIDTVYSLADGRGFRVYSYIPAIYDFPFQHVFWWYGTKKYGYQPEDIAYLPGQPEYILDQKEAWTKKRPTDSGIPIFLIIQGDGDHSQRLTEWLGNFAYLCTVNEHQIIDSLKVVELSSCSK